MIRYLRVSGGVAFLIVALSMVAPFHDANADESRRSSVQLVSANIDKTWEVLISTLSRRPFVINNIRKDQHNLRVLFHSNTPSDFVDCGRISLETDDTVFGKRNREFAAANSSRYLVEVEGTNRLVDVERKTSLNGLADIQLVRSPHGTLVTVKARYVMMFKLREFGANIDVPADDEILKFDSGGSASRREQLRLGTTHQAVTFECRPNGKLERRIVAQLGGSAS